MMSIPFGIRCALLFACLQLATVSGGAKDRAPLEMPNIIYILADDLGYGDLGFLGQEKFSTPNIDRLAAEGMFFSEHYSGSSVCAPSRSALMTGQHTGHTFVRGNFAIQPEGQIPLPKEIATLPKILRERGYVTGAFGKWGLGYPGSEGDPTNHFDRFFGYNCQRLGHHYYPYYLWEDEKKVVLEGNRGFAKEEYAPALIHEETLAFIEENRDRPFFCYIPSIIPHAELAAPEALMEKYRGMFGPETPFIGKDCGEGYRQGDYESQAEPYAAFAAMVHLLDQQVGEIVMKLEDLGLRENTLILFTSDNGPHSEAGADPEFFKSSGPFRGKKRDLYEGGIHVPLIANWPSVVAAGLESEHICAFWDVLPTLVELSHSKEPGGVDGVSFAPTLLGRSEEQSQHDYLYWEFHEKGGRTAVRQGKWKAVRYNVLKNRDARIQLYDLTKDRGERNDIADSHPEIVDKMREIFAQARTDSEVFRFEQ